MVKEKVLKIHDSARVLRFSDDSIVELLSLANEARELAESVNANRRRNPHLNRIMKTMEQEIQSMIEVGISSFERKERFEEALAYFTDDLRTWCITLKV